MRLVSPLLVGCCILMAVSDLYADESRFRAVAERVVAAYNAGDAVSMRADFAQVMLDALSEEQIGQVITGLTAQFGAISELGELKSEQGPQALFAMTMERGVLDLLLVLDAADQIIGLRFMPPAPEETAPERNRTTMRLPFDGAWYVFWGGDTEEQNYHNAYPGQKYAVDFIIRGDDNNSFRTNGATNEDYYCFGEPILAPADGLVIEAVDGLRDNVPGVMNPLMALGNYIMLQHGEEEYSVFAHFQQGTVAVKAGDRVTAGQLLGRCGNSGNSSEPHLHWHLQHKPVMGGALGYKAFFANVLVNGERLEEHAPVRGETVAPAE